MEKLKLHTPDFTEANIANLAELFPNCVTENSDAQGQVKRAIDFDLLKQELSGSIVEGQQERYQLNWPGKREAFKAGYLTIAEIGKERIRRAGRKIRDEIEVAAVGAALAATGPGDGEKSRLKPLLPPLLRLPSLGWTLAFVF